MHSPIPWAHAVSIQTRSRPLACEKNERPERSRNGTFSRTGCQGEAPNAQVMPAPIRSLISFQPLIAWIFLMSPGSDTES